MLHETEANNSTQEEEQEKGGTKGKGSGYPSMRAPVAPVFLFVYILGILCANYISVKNTNLTIWL